jgi:hypothetical protein
MSIRGVCIGTVLELLVPLSLPRTMPGCVVVGVRGVFGLALNFFKLIFAQLSKLGHGVVDPLSLLLCLLAQPLIGLEAVRMPDSHHVFVRL